MIVLSRPTITGEMYGLLATLQAGMGSNLTPAASPIAFVPVARAGELSFGRLQKGDPNYDAYRAHIDRITDQGYARFMIG